MRQKLAQLFQVTQGKDWFPIVGLIFILSLLLIFITGPVDFFNLGLLGQRKDQQISLATQNTCEEIPQEEFGQKPDREKAKLNAALLDGESRNLEKKYQAWKNSQNQQNLKALKQQAKSRKKHLVEAIRTNPDNALFSLLTKETRELLLTETTGCIEDLVTLEGTLEVLHADFFEEGTSQTQYTLITQDNQRIVIHPARGLKDPLESRTKVKVRGFRIDNDLIFDASTSLDKPFYEGSGIDVISQPGNPPVLGEQKSVVILAYFANTSQPSFTPTQVNDTMFASTDSVDSYYRENSYNKIFVSGQVFGWYQLAADQSCDPFGYTQQMIAAADNDVNFTNYSRLILIANFGPSCGWAGVGSMGIFSVNTADGDVNMSIAVIAAVDVPVIGHELGHNFGNHHATFLNCGSVSIATTGCESFEYGDRYDIMGWAGYKGHFNAPHKENAGWFLPSNIQTIDESTESGRFVLEPIETPSDNLKALKIARSQTEYLYVEYRQPIGFDSNFLAYEGTDVFDGAIVHICSIQYTCLIDTTPPTDNNTAAIRPGNTFIDPATETQITVVSRTANRLTVDVVVGREFIAPTVNFTSPTPGSNLSGIVSISVEATDDSGVKNVEFYNADVLIGTDDSLPYGISWDTTHVPNGTASLWARAYDIWGNFTDTQVAQVTIANIDSNPPSVKLISPFAGTTVFGPRLIPLAAEASDNVGIWKVEFYLDPIPFAIAIDSQEPYIHGRNLPAGDYIATFRAKAYDFVGNVTESLPISIHFTTNQLPSLQLLDPDLSDDGAVTLGDTGKVSSAFGAIEGGPNYNQAYDLTADGVITVGDISLVSTYFGTSNWPPTNTLDTPVSPLNVDKPYKLYLIATDQDSQGFPALTAEGLPANASFATEDVTTTTGKKLKRGEFSWTPKASDRGKVYEIIFKADDGACGTSCPTQTLFVKVP